jgi:hypothetical protein
VTVLGLLALVLLLVVVFGSASPRPYDLHDAGDRGYKGLRDVLAANGTTVDELDAEQVDPSMVERLPIVLVPDGAAASAEQAARLRRYAEAGGTVVAAGPIGHLGARSVDDTSVTLPNGGGVRGRCTIDALDDVEGFGTGQSDQLVTPLQVPPGADSCFGDDTRAAVVRQTVGQGQVITVASPDLFTNDSMRPRNQDVDDPKGPMPDNVVMAARLLDRPDGGAIGVVTSGIDRSEVADGSKGIWDLLSAGVKLGLGQLLVAFVFYAAWRARRDGRLVSEPLPVEVPGTELVAATGNLMRRQGDVEAAATVLRRSAQRDLQLRLGLPAGIDLGTLAAVVASRTGRSVDEVGAALGPTPVGDEAGLGRLARTLDRLRADAAGRHDLVSQEAHDA